MKIKPFPILEPDEIPRICIKTTYKNRGYLLLTNIFIRFYEEKGLLKKSYILKFSTKLTDILDVSSGIDIINKKDLSGMVISQSRISYFSINGSKFYPDSVVAEEAVKIFQNAIQEAKSSRTVVLPIHELRNAGNYVYCTKCGFKNNFEANYCNKCGSPF